MSTNTAKFLTRPKTTGSSVDYISMVNQSLNQDPTSVDPNSPIYSEAIKQYNGDLKRGNTTRLEIPKGFCGYIDPKSGEFRVVPDPNLSSIPPGQNIPKITDSTLVPAISEGEYPIDACLVNGLAGSPSYSQTTSRETGEFGEYTKITPTSCGLDDDPVEASGVNWNAIPVNYCIPPTPEQVCMEYWQPGGAGYNAAINGDSSDMTSTGQVGAGAEINTVAGGEFRISVDGGDKEYFGDPAQFTDVKVNGDGSRTVTVRSVTSGGVTRSPNSYSITSDANTHVPIKPGQSYTVPASQWTSGTNRVYVS